MATTDLFSTLVIQNDGEAIDTDDVNAWQSIVNARMCDQILQSLIAGVNGRDPQIGVEFTAGGFSNDAPSNFVYAMTGIAGSPQAHGASGNNGFVITPGTVFQKVGTSTGALPQFLPYTFAGTEGAGLTFANGDP